MRNPNRLDSFYDIFNKLHKSCCPDLRFGQLCLNFFDWLVKDKHKDSFYLEETDILEYFKEYCQEINYAGYEVYNIGG